MYSSTGRPAQVSADPFAVNVDNGGAGTVVGNALAYALVRPGSVVVRLVLGQDSTQMSLAEDQHAIQELSAQGADYAFTDRVHARHPAGRRILAPVVWKTAPDEEVKSGPRSQITNLMSSNRWSRVRAMRTAGSPLAGGIRDDAAEVHPAVPCSMNTRTYSLLSSTVSTCRKSTRGSRRPGRAGTADRSGPRGAAPDRCPQRA